MFPEWTWVVGFWIGAAIGSFLNVVIYRMPRGLSLGEPKHSFCPNCKNQLSWLELIPLVSWAIQGGKCRQCGVKIAPRYFIVELINGSLWGWTWWRYLIMGSQPAEAIAYSLFAAALVAAIFTDLQYYIIPDQVNAFLFLCGVGLNIALIVQGRPEAFIGGVPSSLAGALVGIAVLWGIAFFGRLFFGKDAMGHGDIKMARGIGAVLLPAMALASFALAIVFGALLGMVAIIARMRKAKSEAEVEEEDGPYEPESIGSLLFCGLGYVLLIDIIGLFFPKLYQRWFGEDPFAVDESMLESEVELTMIPFGPSLALGALSAILFRAELEGVWQWYLTTSGLSP